MLNVLITGASGMLGATLAYEFKSSYNVYATGNSGFTGQYSNYRRFDLKSESYEELIEWSDPDVIIHSAALTSGNYCEEHPNEAFDINGMSVQKFLASTKDDVKIIYISTDAVFPSSMHLANEEHCVSPENIYGKSKELGEFFLRTAVNRNHTIIRTTIVGLNLNAEKEGFVEWILNSSKNDKQFGLFTDVLFSPISIWHLAREIEFLINANKINSEILHIAGELCSKYQFGIELLKSLNLPTKTLSKALISSFEDRAKRSNDQSLDSAYYQKKYKRRLPTLDEIISTIKKHYEYNKIRKKNSR
jgi:dTDP-4-dehydrorhamnose reductase